MKKINFWTILLLVSFSFVQCTQVTPELKTAEQVMDSHPDSALHILQKYHINTFSGSKNKALYALLYNQALYKNKILIKSDSLINIAISYYDKRSPLNAGWLWLFKSMSASNGGDAKIQAQALLNAEQYALKSNDKKLLATIYYNKSNMLLTEGQFKSSINYSNNAFNEFIQIKDYRNAVVSLINIGYIYAQNNKYNEAYSYYKKANQYSKYLNDLQIQETINRCLSQTLYNKKEFSKAIYYLKQIKITKDSIYDSNTYYLFANMYFAKNDLDSALVYLNKMKYKGIMAADYYKLFSKIYEKRGNYKKALDYSLKVTLATDSLHKAQLDESFAGLEKKYKYQQLQISNQQLTIKNKQNNILLLFALFIISTGVIIILFWQNRIRQQKIKNQQKIIEQSRELIVKERKILEEKIINNKLLERQNKVQHILLSNVEQFRRNVIKKPGKYEEESDSENPNFYDELIASMDMEYNDISKRLARKFPILTNRDILICCLLLAGFESGMIATILDIKIESINKQRYRLRTKLNLNNSEKLTEYLRNF